MPAFVPAAAMAAIDVMRDEPARQRRVRELARRVRGKLQEMAFVMPPGDSPVIPVILGGETDALDAAKQLVEQGILVVPIRPPSVAVGSSRLRVTVSCEHSDEEVERLIQCLRDLTCL